MDEEVKIQRQIVEKIENEYEELGRLQSQGDRDALSVEGIGRASYLSAQLSREGRKLSEMLARMDRQSMTSTLSMQSLPNVLDKFVDGLPGKLGQFNTPDILRACKESIASYRQQILTESFIRNSAASGASPENAALMLLDKAVKEVIGNFYLSSQSGGSTGDVYSQPSVDQNNKWNENFIKAVGKVKDGDETAAEHRNNIIETTRSGTN